MGALLILAGIVLIFSLSLGINIGPDTFGITTGGNIPWDLSLTTIIGIVLVLVGIILIASSRRRY